MSTAVVWWPRAGPVESAACMDNDRPYCSLITRLMARRPAAASSVVAGRFGRGAGVYVNPAHFIIVYPVMDLLLPTPFSDR